MSELRPKKNIEESAENAYLCGCEITENPHKIGSIEHTVWEQAYLRMSFALALDMGVTA